MQYVLFLLAVFHIRSYFGKVMIVSLLPTSGKIAYVVFGNPLALTFNEN